MKSLNAENRVGLGKIQDDFFLSLSLIDLTSLSRDFSHIFSVIFLSFSSYLKDIPSPPGKPQLEPSTSSSDPDVVTIKWLPPENDSGSAIIGYIVEHKKR